MNQLSTNLRDWSICYRLKEKVSGDLLRITWTGYLCDRNFCNVLNHVTPFKAENQQYRE